MSAANLAAFLLAAFGALRETLEARVLIRFISAQEHEKPVAFLSGS